VTGTGCGVRATQVPLSSRVSPAAQGCCGENFLPLCATHCERSFGLTGAGQHSPLDVRFPAAQHFPAAVGTKPAAQQSEIFGILNFGWHCVPSALGVWPTGQHTPFEVAWLFRQHLPAIFT
jgi:hypothetical protein